MKRAQQSEGLSEDTFIVRIRTENDAFAEDRGGETVRILRELADRIEAGEDFDCFRTLFDINGNDAGRAAFKHRGYR